MPFVVSAECPDQSSLLETYQGMGNDEYQNPWNEKQEVGKPYHYQWRNCHRQSSVERVPYVSKRALSNQFVLSVQQVNLDQVQ
jgi:hypothetical protein